MEFQHRRERLIVKYKQYETLGLNVKWGIQVIIGQCTGRGSQALTQARYKTYPRGNGWLLLLPRPLLPSTFIPLPACTKTFLWGQSDSFILGNAYSSVRFAADEASTEEATMSTRIPIPREILFLNIVWSRVWWPPRGREQQISYLIWLERWLSELWIVLLLRMLCCIILSLSLQRCVESFFPQFSPPLCTLNVW